MPIILSLIVILFLGTYSSVFAKSAIMLDRVVAIVNREAITWSELYKTMEFEFVDSYKDLSEQEKLKFLRENEVAFLEVLIDRKLKIQEAQRIGLTVTNDEVERAISSIKAKHSMTDAIFLETLKKEGFTLEEYRQRLRERILITRLVEQEVRSKIVIDDESINKYLEQKKDLIKVSESYDISHIFIKKTNNKAIDEERARQIYSKLRAGEDFSQTARNYSEDATARYGGELGVIKREDLSDDFIRVLSKMKVGDISEPFWSDRGLHILKLNAISTIDNLNQLKEQAKKEFFEERFNRLYKNWLRGLREKAYIQLL
ncbi:MAG: peptidylprolyl isomerase [Thermodesulfovibrionales bacterium]|nr:peptidylprolyl isomerase [Thermodesulfovibrionales bacterium]